jgi:hypothetical protein
MEDIEVNGNIIVKLISKKYDGKVWIGFACLTMKSPVAGSRIRTKFFFGWLFTYFPKKRGRCRARVTDPPASRALSSLQRLELKLTLKQQVYLEGDTPTVNLKRP